MPQEEEIDALCDMHDVATDSISMQPTSDCMQCLDKYACCQVTWIVPLPLSLSYNFNQGTMHKSSHFKASPPTLLSLGVEVCAQLLKKQIAEEVAKSEVQVFVYLDNMP